MTNCVWASGEPIFTYHEQEHGILPKDNLHLFELLTLEIFQPGLSFNIVLKKRDGLKEYFHHYDLVKISQMDVSDVERGLENRDIIRHRLKIEAIIANAKLIINSNLNLQKYIFDNVDYRFGSEKVGELLAKQMRKDGFKFVGPSVATSFLEAIGLLEGHMDDCRLKSCGAREFSYQTPFGVLHIIYEDFKIRSSTLVHNTKVIVVSPVNTYETFIAYHLDNYFHHNIFSFKFQLAEKGTVFQKQVWDVIKNIPFGKTLTYGDIAYTIGSGAFRAVGGACSKSEFAIFIPAHRVVSSTAIGGFQNQVELKRELLRHEGIEY